MVVGHNGDRGLTVQLLVILELRIGVELAQIQFHNEMEKRVMVQIRILYSASCPTVLVYFASLKANLVFCCWFE